MAHDDVTIVDQRVEFKSKMVNSRDIFKYLYDHHEICEPEATAEAHLQTQVRCGKNPNHENFIPVDDFKEEHLPPSFHDGVIYPFVRLMFGFTVKIDVRMTSPGRPKFWLDSDVPYPFHDSRKRTNLRIGTGSLRGLYKYAEGYKVDGGSEHWKKYTSCACRKCRDSDTPSSVWWEIEVMTATHVVYDDVEASHASCTLFYDRAGCGVVVLDAVTVDFANVETDKCWLRCFTCDAALIARLETMTFEFDAAWRRVQSNYAASMYPDRVALIVSHPHGCTKQITVGSWIDRYALDGDENFSCYTYTTATCPGSSGATVYVLGHHNGQRYTHSDHHVHSGVSKLGTNFCGNGYDI